jgi:peptidoglycan/LPS O-acetylase OafA/YrhL
VSYYSIWPMLALLVALFGLAATPLFKAADSPPSPTRSRVQTLDGLRGFLALAVFFHHGALYHTYIQDGAWRPPSDRLYGLLGSFGVSMFFMITGFLFWTQILDKQGRPDWIRLYIGRVFRIGPIYLAAVGVMVICVFAMSGFHLRVAPIVLARELAEWAALGLRAGSPLNGVAEPGALLANVTWSLRWEWFYYASLIVTAFFARGRLTAWTLPAIGLCGGLVMLLLSHSSSIAPSWFAFICLFCVGMLTATAHNTVAHVDFRKPRYSVMAAVLILTILSFCWTAYDVFPIMLLGAAFFLIANGATLFGLLSTRAARRLGDVSFGIYLLQGLIFGAVFATGSACAISLASPVGHWALIAVAGVLLIALATAAHVTIERPGIALGRKAAQLVRPSKKRSPPAGGGSSSAARTAVSPAPDQWGRANG